MGPPSVMQDVWKKYLDFENYSRKEGDNLNNFITEWKGKMSHVEEAGCHYSDLVLALKLIEKANLKADFVTSILSTMGSLDHDNCLSEVVTSINNHYYNQSDVCAADDQGPNDPYQVPSDGIYVGKEVLYHKVTEFLNCPVCFCCLTTRTNYDKGNVFACNVCETSVMVKTVLGKEVELVVLPKCHKCGKSLQPSVDSVSGEITNFDVSGGTAEEKLGCRECGIFIVDDRLKNTSQTLSQSGSSGLLKSKAKSKKKASVKSNNNKYACIQCDDFFSSSMELEVHSKVHQRVSRKMVKKKSKLLGCSFCDKRFMSLENLELHMTMHKDENLTNSTSVFPNVHNQTPTDGNDNPNNALSARHEPIDSPADDTYDCNLCGKQFLHKKRLARHVETSHQHEFNLFDPEEAHRCRMCLKELDNLDNLISHVQDHSDDELDAESGIKNDEKKNYLEYLDQVKSEVGIGGKENTGGFGLSDELASVAAAQGDSTHRKCSSRSTKAPCEVCGKLFSLTHLKAHVATHNSTKDFECSVCKKRFLTIYQLKIHLGVHKTEGDFLCTFCGKGLKTKSSLAYHLNLHTKAKTWDCAACSRKFLSQCSLSHHTRVHHTGEKPYKCDHCHLKFFTSSKKMDHMRLHTGERPYGCNICGKHFRLRSNQKRHMMKVHTNSTEMMTGF